MYVIHFWSQELFQVFPLILRWRLNVVVQNGGVGWQLQCWNRNVCSSCYGLSFWCKKQICLGQFLESRECHVISIAMLSQLLLIANAPVFPAYNEMSISIYLHLPFGIPSYSCSIVMVLHPSNCTRAATLWNRLTTCILGTDAGFVSGLELFWKCAGILEPAATQKCSQCCETTSP